MQTLKEVLMRRDGLTETEADEQISNAHDEFDAMLDDCDGDMYELENFMEDEFGLEPDFLIEFLM